MVKKRKWTKEEVDEYRKGSDFYCNKEDANIFVHKAGRLGHTLNWGNPFSVILFVLLIGAIILYMLAFR